MLLCAKTYKLIKLSMISLNKLKMFLNVFQPTHHNLDF